MSSYRVTFVALATFFSIGMTSIASACCDWGYSAPVTYAPAYGGCGGCGAPTAAAVYAAPVAPAPIYINPVVPTAFGGPCCGFNGCGNCGMSDWSGCGGCGSVGYGGYGGCGGCGVANWGGGGGCGGCGRGYAAASLYVVNQGPTYTGPGVTVPYATYSPETAYAPAADYPYAPGYGYGQPPYPNYYARPYYRQRYAYHSPAYMHPRYYGPAQRYYRGGAPRWRHYP